MEEKHRDELVLLGQAGIPTAAVLAHVEELCNSPAFDDGEQARKLIRYLVEQALAGRVPSANAVALALGKKDLSVADTFVRTAMGRLRNRLSRYYKQNTRRSEMKLIIPNGGYLVFAPKNTNFSVSASRQAIGTIIEPAELEMVGLTFWVRGIAEEIDPDLRLWLIIQGLDSVYFPQCRVSRRSSSWECELTGVLRGVEGPNEYIYDILLVAVTPDGDVEFHQCVKRGGHPVGTLLPSDTTVLDRRQVLSFFSQARNLSFDHKVKQRPPEGVIIQLVD